uniref:Fucosyltransferase N-terminal domain-containing protein n=1 Tax=Stegastes partitus TaxID=144197 RepID=A0A3B4ZJF5_9TELE
SPSPGYVVTQSATQSEMLNYGSTFVGVSLFAVKFDFKVCFMYSNISVLTDDRSLHSKAQAVIFFHRATEWHLRNTPQEPHTAFQKQIWFNVESPTTAAKKPDLDNLCNLTLKKTGMKDDFVLPKKDRLVRWIVSNNNDLMLERHMKINVCGAGFCSRPTEIGRFYLPFHWDCTTVKVNMSLVAGTVPVGLNKHWYKQQNRKSYYNWKINWISHS